MNLYVCTHTYGMNKLTWMVYVYIYIVIIQHGSVSYNTVVLYSRDRYEIIGLRKSSHSIKQPCSSICLKKAFAMHQSC